MASLWTLLNPLIFRLKPETRLLLLVCIPLGAASLLLVPPVTTFDAPSHYYRSVSIEQGDFLTLQRSSTEVGSEIPRRHIHFVDTLWRSYWPEHRFGSPSEWARVSDEAQARSGREFVSYTNTAVYHPFNYTFQSAGMGLSTLVSRSPLAAHRVGCLFNLTGVMLLLMLCIELTPRFERAFLLFATMPLTLIQATSLSPDGINFALPALLLALVLRLRTEDEPKPRMVIATLLAALGVCMLKPTAISSLPCLLFIPSRHLGSRLRTTLAVTGTLLLGAVLWGGWVHRYGNVDIEHFLNVNEPHPSDMRATLLHHPEEFVSQFSTYLVRDLHTQTPHFYGDVGGWVNDWVIDLLPVFSGIFCLGLLGCPAPRSTRTDHPWACLLLMQAFGSLLLIGLTLYLKFEHRGCDTIRAFSGRYHFVFMSCLALGILEWLRDRWTGWRPVLFWAAFLANIIFVVIILSSIGSRVLS